MSWIFLDPTCPKPYSFESLQLGGIGGTEATVVRIAEALRAPVMQHNRTQDKYAHGQSSYLAPRTEPVPGVTAVVVLRCPVTALATRSRYRCQPIYLWCHDLADKKLATHLEALASANIEIICVSKFHAHNIREAARAFAPDKPQPRMHVIYNPIEDALVPDATPVQPNKLVFFSSPHKGLAWTLEMFNILKTHWRPELELYIANPGYLPLPSLSSPGVHVLGAIPRQAVLQHVREAFLVLHLNHVFPETFGLVSAEANAVGTPVLTHALGAAMEVLEDSRQCVDTRDRKKLVDAFTHWHPGNRPVVHGQEQFRLREVLKKWRALE